MRNLLSTRQIVFAGTMIFVLALGASALFSKAEANGCICPLIYAPVTCDHNKTYPNQCEADCHHAKNCVPSGIFATR
jgi:hypothetical protein